MSNDFSEKYRQFYADIYAFHKKYYLADSLEDFIACSREVGALGNKYPACRSAIVETFNLIESDYVMRIK